ncbi:hypothetical protein JCM11641_003225 [Rhodosporidiobolus odoratus]
MGRLGFLSSQPKRSWGNDSDEGEENVHPLPSTSSNTTTTTTHKPQLPSSFDLTDDWPPTPPKSRPGKANAAAAQRAKEVEREREREREAKKKAAIARAAKAGAGVSSSAHGQPLAPKPTSNMFASTSTSSSKPAPKIAPMFRRPGASSSSAATSASGSTSSASAVKRTASTGSSTYAFTHASTSRTSSTSSSSASTSSVGVGSVLPKKRALPWEGLETTSSSSTKLSRTSSSSSNFHALNGPTGAGGRLAAGMKEKMLTSSAMDIKQKVILSPEQQMVLKLVVEDEKNVFFTGSAGTGKSVLLREIIASLKRKYRGGSDAVAVTASTGMAACNIGGVTIHSFAGIGIGQGTAEQLIANIKKNRNANAKWQRVKVLVVDEVSMVDGYLFDKLAAIATALKKKAGKSGSAAAGKPFGGIQLVVTGDFFQLPPVTKGVTPTFAFEAAAWKQCIDHTVNLTQVFRQKDTEFINMLNEMRFGRLSQESIKKFYALQREPKYPIGIEPTELFPMRNEVERSNQNRLRALKGDEHTFKSEDTTADPDPARQKTNPYLNNFMAPDSLTLKVGAQVMLIKNLDLTLVNGTVGTVVGFGVPELEGEDEDSGLRGGGVGGVGDEVFLTADGTELRIKPELSAMDARKKQRIVDAVASGKIELGPVVDWQTPQGVERKTMVREEFKVEDGQGKVLAKRRQYPIILYEALHLLLPALSRFLFLLHVSLTTRPLLSPYSAWAMSIHKSQGQTIARVKVDLGKVFEKGQSYVALSRATSLDGLQVLRFDPKKVAAHEKVVAWSRSLQVLG